MKPIIGIVARPIKSGVDNQVSVVYEDCRRAVIKAGGIPISILSSCDTLYDLDEYTYQELSDENKKDLIKVLKLCDGIILQGGCRVYRYDEFIVNYVINEDIPTLGICFGMQLLNIVDTKSYPIMKNSQINHSQKNNNYVHEIRITKDSLLYKILKKDLIKVNSRHRYSITGVNNFKVCAISKDFVIEGIYYPLKKFILGVQYHPESMIDYDLDALKLFEYFINCCKK